MDKPSSLRRTLLIILSYVLVATLAAGVAFWTSDAWGSPKLTALKNVIEQRFVGTVDESAMEDAAAQAMVASLGDRWSRYLTAAEYESQKQSSKNAYVGIGITIQQRADGTGLDIPKVEPGGPAQEAGLQAGDVLIEVQGESIAGMNTTQVKERVQGKEGTVVELVVLRNGERLNFSVTRRQIKMAAADGQMLAENVGLVTIYNFNTNCANETIAVIEELTGQGAQALIFDVRNNGGGYLTELIDLLDYLLPEGVIVRMQDEKGKEKQEHSDEACLELPMAVLINGRTYSAAELFAAALEEYNWGITVGNSTTGKGYYQYTIPLPDGSAVVLSTGKYMTPNGVNLQEAGGLLPNVDVPVDAAVDAKIYARELPAQEDPQIQAALNALTMG